MARHHGPFALLFTIFCALLAACGAPAATAPTAPPPTPVPPTSAPTLAATSAPSAAATAAPTVAVAEGPYAGLEQGRTAEGYQTLGSPEAAVTLVMYSDFL